MVDVIPLSEAVDVDASEIGNKAAGLAELLASGQRVPPGFCITTAVYRERVAQGSLSPRAQAAIISEFEKLTPPVAVRSSSPAEDRADASFAGQYTTILGVRSEAELLTAIEECWASVNSEAALAYRRDHETDATVPMAVLVQELVAATTSGVLFTMHPVTGNAGSIVVNANYGLGESVVSGKADPDTIVLDKGSARVLERNCGSKRVMTQLADDGVEDVPVPVSEQGIVCIDEEKLPVLFAAAREVEQHYDFPMDIEWAFAGDELYLLQARPVTTGAEAHYTWLLDEWARERGLVEAPDGLWSRGTPMSSLAVSPLYYSEMAAFFSDMFPQVARLHGGTGDRTKNFRYHRAFTYQSVGFESTANPSGAVVPLNITSSAWRANLRIAMRYPRSLAFWCNIDHYYRMWDQKWWPAIESKRPDYSSASMEQIRAFIDFVEAQRRERSIVAACGVGYAGDFLGLLAHVIEKWAPGFGEDTVGLLTSGLPDSLTHDENLELWELARAAASSSGLRTTIIAGDYDNLDSDPDGTRFLVAVDDFRRRRPHRGCSDRDLAQPRWGDSRNLLLRQVAVMLRLGGDADPRLAHARTEKKRQLLEAQILDRIGSGPVSSFRKWMFRRILRATQRYWMQRDNQRHSFDRYFYELRCAYRALGDRLCACGALPQVDDVFFLGKEEVYGGIDGTLSPHVLRRRAEWRREWWQVVSEEEPPIMLRGNQPYDPQGGESEPADLKGAGGAPGTGTGSVRVVRSLDQLEAVQDGEILVTQAIDPAWTPIFGIIGGVISEEGGMLSHATVLGREYGLPVVISAAGACSRLHTGMQVSIDGTAGTIHILSGDEVTTSEPAQAR